MSQRSQVVSKSWKAKGTKSPLNPPEEMQHYKYHDFSEKNDQNPIIKKCKIIFVVVSH